jgi:hypothetical protein
MMPLLDAHAYIFIKFACVHMWFHHDRETNPIGTLQVVFLSSGKILE